MGSIEAIAKAVAGKTPRAIPDLPQQLRLSGLESFTLTPEIPFVNVGERTNVTGSAKFRKLITAGDYAEIASSSQRVRSQLHALLMGGWGRYRQVRRLHQLATELVDDIELIDGDRALRHAGAAGRALPELFLGDVVVEEAIRANVGDRR